MPFGKPFDVGARCEKITGSIDWAMASNVYDRLRLLFDGFSDEECSHFKSSPHFEAVMKWENLRERLLPKPKQER